MWLKVSKFLTCGPLVHTHIWSKQSSRSCSFPPVASFAAPFDWPPNSLRGWHDQISHSHSWPGRELGPIPHLLKCHLLYHLGKKYETKYYYFHISVILIMIWKQFNFILCVLFNVLRWDYSWLCILPATTTKKKHLIYIFCQSSCRSHDHVTLTDEPTQYTLFIV